MNGVHDMGGMHGLGSVAPEANEPVFHMRWEARALALTLAAGACGRWNIDKSRFARERIPGPDYLRMSYYEKWIAGLETLLTETGLVSREELAAGRSASRVADVSPPLIADRVAATLAQGGPTERKVTVEPRLSVGERIRARNLNPTEHTRLPRYVRGKCGTITRRHGAHVFPDANAHGRGEQPQHLYQVRFEGRELWGEQAIGPGAVYLDLWEDYLEPG